MTHMLQSNYMKWKSVWFTCCNLIIWMKIRMIRMLQSVWSPQILCTVILFRISLQETFAITTENQIFSVASLTKHHYNNLKFSAFCITGKKFSIFLNKNVSNCSIVNFHFFFGCNDTIIYYLRIICFEQIDKLNCFYEYYA